MHFYCFRENIGVVSTFQPFLDIVRRCCSTISIQTKSVWHKHNGHKKVDKNAGKILHGTKKANKMSWKPWHNCWQQKMADIVQLCCQQNVSHPPLEVVVLRCGMIDMACQTGNKACITGDPETYWNHHTTFINLTLSLTSSPSFSETFFLQILKSTGWDYHTHTRTQWTSQIILLSHLLLFNFTDDILLTTSCNTINVSKLKFGSIVASTIGNVASVFI